MIAIERLVMLALGELDATAAAEVEEHILSCGACASTLERVLAIGDAARDLVLAGKVASPISPALLAELEAAGLVSRRYHLAPDRVLPCTVGADDVYSLTTLEADLRDVEHVDLVQTTPLGAIRMRDVPFDAERGLVSYVSRADLLRALPSARIRLELFAVDASGERKVSEYFLEHTAYHPAP
jgi:putative zinc finger protein